MYAFHIYVCDLYTHIYMYVCIYIKTHQRGKVNVFKNLKQIFNFITDRWKEKIGVFQLPS